MVTFFVCVVPPPLQAYVTPVAGDAVSVVLVFVQVNCAGAAILAVGAVLFCVTATLALAVHPLAASVTVTLYVPGVVTDLVWLVPPPLQLYVTPVAGEAVSVVLVVVQVSCAGVPMLAVGKLLSCVTVTVALALQPFVVLVTVTL